nr:MAG TPA_asm: collagen triple helix repeat protein [Caudoviricetes sp.]
MRTVIVRDVTSIPLGRQGENLAAQVVWPDIVEKYRALYGEGTFALTARRNGDKARYPVKLSTDGVSLFWDVQRADVAMAGGGSCELTYTAGNTVAKSQSWNTIVLRSEDGRELTTPPPAYQSWVDEVLKAGAGVETAVAKMPYVDSATGHWFKWDAAQNAFADTGIAATGPQGATGPAGPQGEQGEAGPRGERGPAGATGATGARGETGPKGDKGDAGAQGERGLRGETGATGPRGPIGPVGPQGERGPIGATGPQGLTGPVGPQGTQGETGPRGATGPQGPEGKQGPRGETGATGPQGEPGPAGKDGITPEIVEGELVTVPSAGVGGETWEKIAEIDFDVDAANDVSVWEYKNLPNYKELAYRKEELAGSAETASGVSISINGSSPQPSGISYSNKGNSDSGWGKICPLPFGWVHICTRYAISPTNYSMGGLSAMYCAMPFTGERITSVKLSAHTIYKIASGKLSLYGRR